MEPAPIRYAPRPTETAMAAAAGVILLGLGMVTASPGRFLGFVAGAGLLVLVGADMLVRPRLTAGPLGLTIRTVTRNVHLPWPDVDSVRVDQRQRYGLRVRTLEIDAGNDLYLLGRRSLGVDPLDAAEAISTIRR